MRIGIDAGCLGVSDERLKGGIYRMAENLLVALTALKADCHFFLYSFQAMAPQFLRRLDGRFTARIIGPRKGWLDIAVVRALFSDRIDLFWGLSQALPVIQLGKKSLVFIHDLAYEYFPSWYSSQFIWRSRWSISQATGLIAFSSVTKRDIVKFTNRTKGIFVLKQGLNTALFYPRPRFQIRQIMKKYKLSKPYFLYVGAIKPIKNTDAIFQAFRVFSQRHPGYDLVIAGSDYWKRIERTRSLHEHFLGYIPDEDLPSLYSGATAFLHPSLYEGFGHPVLEALSCGCPAIVSHRGSLPEIVGDATLVIDPTNIGELLSSMESLATNRKLRQEKIIRGLKRIQLFSWENYARKVLATSWKIFKS